MHTCAPLQFSTEFPLLSTVEMFTFWPPFFAFLFAFLTVNFQGCYGFSAHVCTSWRMHAFPRSRRQLQEPAPQNDADHSHLSVERLGFHRRSHLLHRTRRSRRH